MSSRPPLHAIVTVAIIVGIAPTATADFFHPEAKEPPEHSAQPQLELDVNFIIPSESGSPSSGAHFGGQLGAVGWRGRVGLAIDASRVWWDGDGHLNAVGLAARIALTEGQIDCGNRIFMNPSPKPTPDCQVRGRVWFEIGGAREHWRLDDDTVSARVIRNRFNVAIGVDFGVSHWAGSVFFRVHKARPDQLMTSTGERIEEPYATSLVFGTGFQFGI